MNQLCKNLVTKNFMFKNALNSVKYINNKNFLLTQAISCLSSLRILNNAETFKTSQRLYVTNTDSTSSYKVKYDREEKGEFQPRNRDYSRKPNFRNRPEFEDRNDRFGSKEEDFENAEPVEPTGTKVDYLNKEHHNFGNFNIPEKLLARLKELGYTQPFEIQEKTLPHTLAGKDLVGKAFTGSGKTLAFAIPIISQIIKSENKNSRYPKCLVLSPTRELCLQLTKTIQDLAPDMKCLSIVGGTGYEYQISALNQKVDIVCATPGRLKDLMNRKNFIPDDIEIICLDEADELLNPNFQEQIHDVIEMTNKKQMLMFSATINKSVQGIIGTYMKNPVTVDLTEGQKQKLPANIEHFVVKAGESNFNDIIVHCIDKFKSERCIVFTNMKRDAIRLNFNLSRNGFRCSDLHSDLSQRKREDILRKFRTGYYNIIIATDVAARGIDIPEVDLVIQAGAPSNGVDFYIHRSGRTGRAGRAGRSILIEDGTKENFMRMITRLVKFKPLELPDHMAEKISLPTNFEERPRSFNERPRSFDGRPRNFDERPRFKKNYESRDYDRSNMNRFTKSFNKDRNYERFYKDE
ncbi:unnamed protein product [Brachionus calyciflorus]|uniref:RNA helicase n=1 Tax=Brachionus calyciflorus TaxID=104777 RepID=A0A813M6S9_9BILA|nr:unnamed protein product [Brachionus calyciflorus]